MMMLEPGENIVYKVRKHLLLFYARIFGTAVFIIVLPVIYDIAVSYLLKNVTKEFWYISLFAYLVIILMAWIYAFISWTDYYLDTWIITDKKVVDFELHGLFARDITTVDLRNIQDVKIVVRGFINTFLKIGEINMQTAGTEKEFVIKNVSDPEMAKEAIIRAMAAARPGPGYTGVGSSGMINMARM